MRVLGVGLIHLYYIYRYIEKSTIYIDILFICIICISSISKTASCNLNAAAKESRNVFVPLNLNDKPVSF